MSNCFNPYGNPIFNQFVLSALGSKNMRMLVVLNAQGEVLASSMYKIKRHKDMPVLFLEAGLTRVGYDFQKEMLSFLEQKVKTLPKICEVFYQGKGPLKVSGIGSYTGREYVEPVFGIRDSWHTVHEGKRYQHLGNAPEITLLPHDEALPLNTLPGIVTQIQGIGTSHKSIEEYLVELQRGNVELVVDVRGNPSSRYFPHFSQQNLRSALKGAGIDYVFLGNYLGNPKNEQGERSLAGFIGHQQTDYYKKGIQRLNDYLDQGKIVAITCAEGKGERLSPQIHSRISKTDENKWKLRQGRRATDESKKPIDVAILTGPVGDSLHRPVS
ncbi:MAG: DUF488 domain-containing protein [Bdellovibrionales bacterium]|nr:DUF488 domain-containing protein [Bdellovibrionales bacterium]